MPREFQRARHEAIVGGTESGHGYSNSMMPGDIIPTLSWPGACH